jgi:hypothetical protein
MFDAMHLQDFDEGFFSGHFHRNIPFVSSCRLSAGSS